MSLTREQRCLTQAECWRTQALVAALRGVAEAVAFTGRDPKGASVELEKHFKVADVALANMDDAVVTNEVFEAYDAFTQAAGKANVTIVSEAVFGMVAHDFYTHKFMMDKASCYYWTIDFNI